MKHIILISAFSCSSLKGSEPGVGWRWAIEAAKTQEVYVLTRTKCKEELESAVPKELKENLHFIFVDSSYKLRKISIYLEYIHWQRKAYKFIKNKYDYSKFDYSIHLTFGNILLPYWIYKLNIPHIWGPLGGGEYIPINFYKNLGFKQKILNFIKLLCIKTAYINPIVLKPSKKSKAILVRTNDTKKCILPKYRKKTILKLETVMNENDMQISKTKKIKGNEENIKIIVTGKLTGRKNVTLVINSMIELSYQYDNIELHIVGDGPFRKKIEKKCIEIKDKVFFYGNISRKETLQLVDQADIFAFPSLKEGGSWSLMEGMLLRKPVVCFKKSGMEVIMDEKCGFFVEMNNYKQANTDFTEALRKLIDDKELRDKTGNEAYLRIKNNFSNESLCSFIAKLLDDLDERSLTSEERKNFNQ